MRVHGAYGELATLAWKCIDTSRIKWPFHSISILPKLLSFVAVVIAKDQPKPKNSSCCFEIAFSVFGLGIEPRIFARERKGGEERVSFSIWELDLSLEMH
jgi:hypothetical protein